MKFEIGDVLVDAERDLDAPMRIVKVESRSTDYWGDKYYLKYGEDLYVWLYASMVEDEWRKAPIGTVAWLIHELSKHDPLEKVFYLDDCCRERVTDVVGKASGGVFVC